MPRIREADLLALDLRELHYGSGRRRTHRIVYRVRDDLIEVVAIQHHAQRDLIAEDIDSE